MTIKHHYVSNQCDWENELPPVGAVCERKLPGERWVMCKIIAEDSGAVWVKTGEGHSTFVDPSVFRPIPTKEQRDRDELNQIIDAAMRSGDGDAASAIMAAGWTKT